MRARPSSAKSIFALVAALGAATGCLQHPMPPAEAPPDAVAVDEPADLAVPVAQDAGVTSDGNRVEVDLDPGWRFHKGDVAGAATVAFDDAGWAAIDLPHTWNASDGQAGGNAYYRGIGWYRRHLTVDASAPSERRRYLQFDGANLVTELFVNGQRVGQHRGGYARFRFDVTALLTGGDNVIAVKVDNSFQADVPPLDADYSFFGGLYRDVRLLTTRALHVSTMDYASSGVYLRASNVGSASAELQLTVKAQNDDTVAHDAGLRAHVLDAGGHEVATLSSTQAMAAGAGAELHATATLASPHLWNAQADPYLYRVVVELADGSAVVDRVTQPLGIRAYTVDAKSGLSLNGRALDVHGVNRHQDRLDRGWAIGDAQHDEDFALIEEMGATAIRLAHYQHAQHFYDLADQRGMIVWAEIPLIDYINTSTAFRDNCKQQLIELIRQNYNHPAIFWWSISNEITLKPGPDPTALQNELGALARSEDSSRPSTLASVGATSDLAHSDVIGYNKYYGWYYGTYNDIGPWADTQHAQTPTVPFSLSEYGAGASIAMHADQPKMGDHTEEYQALYHEAHWRALKSRPFVWGKFVWNMFDFASSSRLEGDTPGRNDKGLVTYDRKTRKDAFYFYKASWTKTPFVYIASRRFVTRTQATTAVKVYGTMASVELKLNGVSLGSKSASDGVYVWPSVTLVKGHNRVEAVGTSGASKVQDAVDWTLN